VPPCGDYELLHSSQVDRKTTHNAKVNWFCFFLKILSETRSSLKHFLNVNEMDFHRVCKSQKQNLMNLLASISKVWAMLLKGCCLFVEHEDEIKEH